MNTTALFSGLGGGADGADGFSMPSASTMVAAGSTAAIGYVLWEQLKFRLYKAGKNGYQMPGERVRSLGGERARDSRGARQPDCVGMGQLPSVAWQRRMCSPTRRAHA